MEETYLEQVWTKLAPGILKARRGLEAGAQQETWSSAENVYYSTLVYDAYHDLHCSRQLATFLLQKYKALAEDVVEPFARRAKRARTSCAAGASPQQAAVAEALDACQRVLTALRRVAKFLYFLDNARRDPNHAALHDLTVERTQASAAMAVLGPLLDSGALDPGHLLAQPWLQRAEARSAASLVLTALGPPPKVPASSRCHAAPLPAPEPTDVLRQRWLAAADLLDAGHPLPCHWTRGALSACPAAFKAQVQALLVCAHRPSLLSALAADSGALDNVLAMVYRHQVWGCVLDAHAAAAAMTAAAAAASRDHCCSPAAASFSDEEDCLRADGLNLPAFGRRVAVRHRLPGSSLDGRAGAALPPWHAAAGPSSPFSGLLAEPFRALRQLRDVVPNPALPSSVHNWCWPHAEAPPCCSSASRACADHTRQPRPPRSVAHRSPARAGPSGSASQAACAPAAGQPRAEARSTPTTPEAVRRCLQPFHRTKPSP